VLSGLIALAAAVAAQQRPAQSAAGPASFLESYGDRAISVLSDGSRSEAQQRGAFGDLLREGFDLESISAFVLTPYWRQASDQQRSRFIDVFQAVLAQRFLPLFEGARSESFAIESTRNIGGREDLYSVETVLIGDSGRRVNTSWRIKETGGGYRILDVNVEGASMAHTFRDEYRSFVRRSDQGIDGLIQQLEQRTKD
jgi:phospholipid transport system substrate-binding protein